MSTRKGLAYDVAVEGHYVYEVDETSLMVIDVAKPEAPVLLSTLPMGAARSVAVADGVAYVANGAGGLKIIDVRVAARPSVMATLSGIGDVIDVAVAGSVVFLAKGDAGLSVVDVSNPAVPQVLGGLTFASGIRYSQAVSVAVMGKYVLVAMGSDGLAVVDATEPTALRKVAQLDSNIVDVAVQASYAYLADVTQGLRIVDMSNPMRPIVTAELAMPAARSIAVSGTYAYLSTDGLSVVDIEKPALPRLVGFIDGMPWADGLAVAKGWVYVTDHNDGLLIVAPDGAVNRAVTKTTAIAGGAYDRAYGDFFSYTVNFRGLTALEVWGVVDPEPPIPSSLSFKLDLWGGAQAVDVQDDYAYLASGQQGFRVIASKGISRPRLEGELPATWTRAVVSQGDIAYTLRTDAGLEVLNIRNPALPVKVGAYATGIEGRGLALQGSILFALDGSQGLTILDVSDATTPRRLGQWNVGIEPWAVAVSNNYAYIVDRAGLAILDVSDLSQPRVVGRYHAAPLDAQIAVQGERVYMAMNNTLSVIDMADPANPSLLSTFDSQDSIAGLASAEALLYVSTLNRGMIVLDLHDVRNPVIKGTWKPQNSVHVVQAVGNRVYAANGNELYILDVENPSTPVLLGRALIGGWAEQISINGTVAFIARGSAGLHVVDLSDDMNPRLLGHYIVSPSNVTDIVAAGDIVYAADRDIGVLVIDVSAATSPSLRAAFPLVRGAERLVVDGNYVYALNGWGLFVIDMSDPVAPQLIAEVVVQGAQDVLLHEGIAYIATYSSLIVLDVTVPAQPILRAPLYLLTNETPYDLAIHANTLYMTMTTGGLQAFDVKEPARPRFLAAASISGRTYRVTATSGGIYVSNQFGVAKLRPLLHGLP